MKKFNRNMQVEIIFFVFIFLFGLFTFVYADPSIAPTNPDFQNYLQAPRNVKVQKQTIQDHSLGLIASPVDRSYMKGQNIVNQVKGPATLFGYSALYDLRTQGKLTPIKNQGIYGTCWAFATYGSLESFLLPAETWDFSENNLVNLAGFDVIDGYNGGGNYQMSTAYLTRWSGPVNESDDPYPNQGGSPQGLPVQKHIQDVFFIPDRGSSSDNDNIKQMVTNYGAVMTAMYYNSNYYNSTNRTYYYNGSQTINHGVTIVGWDDNYDKNKFSTVPPGNGAFIIRNSWGTGWGDGGYFYISYYDSKIGTDSAVFDIVESTENYYKIYQYDPLGRTTDYGDGSNTEWFANIFTATSNEQLKAVGFYTASLNSSYEIYIYNSFNGTSFSGLLGSKTGTIPIAGYHTIQLDSLIPILLNCNFCVVVKLTTPGYNYPVPVEYPFSNYSGQATASAGQSYVSSDGTSWSDITTDCPNTNVCLKAYTLLPITPGKITDLAASTDLQIKLDWTATGEDLNEGDVTNGEWNIAYSSSQGTTPELAENTTSYTASWSTGTAQSKTIRNLTAGVTYYFWVRAKNGVGTYGSWSDSATAVASGPTINALNVTTRTLSISWGVNSPVWTQYSAEISSDNFASIIESSTTVNTTMTFEGLMPNTGYWTRVKAENGNPDDTVTSTIISTATYALAPDGLTLIGVSSNTANISWNANGNPEWTQYGIELSTQSGTGYVEYDVQIGTMAEISGLMPSTTYYIQTVAINSLGVRTTNSNEIEFRTNAAIPEAPTGFIGVVQSTGNIKWQWILSTNATYYMLYTTSGNVITEIAEGINEYLQESLGANTLNASYVKAGNISGLSGASNSDAKYTYATVPAVINVSSVTTTSLVINWSDTGASGYYAYENGNMISSGSSSQRTYTRTGLSQNTTYTYVVYAINGDYVFTSSTTKSISTLAGTLPLAPVNFSGTVQSTGSIKWQWTLSANATYYKLYTTSGNVITEIAEGINEYLQESLGANTLNVLYVKAGNISGLSGASNSDAKYTYAIVPSSITLGGVTASSIDTEWTNTGATQYRIEVASSDVGTWVFVSSTAGTSYTNTTLSADTTYYYRIGAINGDLLQTPVRYSQVSGTVTLPAGPTGVNAQVNSTDSITWSWSTGSVVGASVLGFRVYDSNTGGTMLVQLGVAQSSWTENGLSVNTIYNRYIRTFNATGESASSQISAQTSANSPTALSASAISAHSITLIWNTNNAISARLYCSSDAIAWSIIADNIAPTTTSYTTTGLHFDTTYYFGIFGYNANGTLTVSSSSLIVKTLELPLDATLMFSSTTYTQTDSAQGANGKVEVIIPVGATLQDFYMEISTNAENSPSEVSKYALDSATNKLDTNGEQMVGGSIVEFKRFDVNGNLITGNFAKKVKLVMTYIDANNDGFVDGNTPPIKASEIRIYCLNATTLAWEVVEGEQILDEVAKTVTVEIEHFSIYALVMASSVKGDLKEVKVYPNPYKPGSASIFDNTAFGSGVVFDNLTAKAKVRIYNIAGELVSEISEDDGDGKYLWPGVNGNGEKLASGIYIYIITNPDDSSQKAKGKIAIIR